MGHEPWASCSHGKFLVGKIKYQSKFLDEFIKSIGILIEGAKAHEDRDRATIDQEYVKAAENEACEILFRFRQKPSRKQEVKDETLRELGYKEEIWKDMLVTYRDLLERNKDSSIFQNMVKYLTKVEKRFTNKEYLYRISEECLDEIFEYEYKRERKDMEYNQKDDGKILTREDFEKCRWDNIDPYGKPYRKTK